MAGGRVSLNAMRRASARVARSAFDVTQLATVPVGDGVGVGDIVGVGVGVGVFVGVGVGVGFFVGVGVGVGVFVGVAVGVGVGVAVPTGVGVGVGADVPFGVGVLTGPWGTTFGKEPPPPPHDAISAANAKAAATEIPTRAAARRLAIWRLIRGTLGSAFAA
jgi:hypothetical protein